VLVPIFLRALETLSLLPSLKGRRAKNMAEYKANRLVAKGPSKPAGDFGEIGDRAEIVDSGDIVDRGDVIDSGDIIDRGDIVDIVDRGDIIDTGDIIDRVDIVDIVDRGHIGDLADAGDSVDVVDTGDIVDRGVIDDVGDLVDIGVVGEDPQPFKAPARKASAAGSVARNAATEWSPAPSSRVLAQQRAAIVNSTKPAQQPAGKI
jgi:hypothetical protein